MLIGDPELSLLPQRLRETPPASIYYRKVTEETMVLLKDALSHMVFLKDFAWSQDVIPTQAFNNISDVLPPHLEGLSTTFSCKSDSESCADFEMKFETIDSLSIWSLTGLTRIIVNEATEAAIQMTISCPDITDLSLQDLTNTSASYLMQHAHWKNLRRLNLGSYLYVEDATIMTSFFERHNTIESMQLDLHENSLPELPSTYLPNLRSISATDGLVASLLPKIIPRVVHWQCLKDEIYHYDDSFGPETEIMNADDLPRMDNLESFYVTGRNSPDEITTFLNKASNLKKISFQLGEIGDSDWIGPDMEPEALPKIFRFSNNLTHIFFDFELFPESSESEGQDHDNVTHTQNSNLEEQRLEYLYQSLSALKTLKYIQTQPSTSLAQVELERDEYGKYSGHHTVELEAPERWGDFFRRLTD